MADDNSISSGSLTKGQSFVITLAIFVLTMVVLKVFGDFLHKFYKNRLPSCLPYPAFFLNTRLYTLNVSLIDGMVFVGYMAINLAFIQYTNPTVLWQDSIGQLVVGNSAFILLPIYRNSIFTIIFGIPFERLLIWHRWLGRIMLVEIGFHMLGYWIQWGAIGAVASQSAVTSTTYGYAAFAFMILIFITSLNYIRRHYFEVFYYSHYLWILWSIMGILHWPPMLIYMLPGILMYIGDRIVRWYIGHKRLAEVVSMIKNGDTVRIEMRKDRMKFITGQYVFINIPQISKLQWHPFTISSPPTHLPDSFTIHVKQLGTFSERVHNDIFPPNSQGWVELPNPQSVQILVDGPYGKPAIIPDDYEVVVLISGGVGVTPMLSMLQNIYDRMRMRDGKLITQKVYFIWTIKTFYMFELFQYIFTDIKQSEVANCFSFYIHISQGKVDDALYQVGRPNLKDYFERMIEQFPAVSRIAVFACGPDELTNDVWDSCYYFTGKERRFEFHHETFDF